MENPRIRIAIDSFKGSLTSREAAEALIRGIRAVLPEADLAFLPIADGGEGTVEALLAGRGGRTVEKIVEGPLPGRMVRARYGLMEDGSAVIEMAEASGLALLREEERNPLLTTTYGTGELILDALNHGARKIYIGAGGSATNDGGLGMLQALGVWANDAEGRELPPGGGALTFLQTLSFEHLDERLKDTEIILLSDVENPLLGREGAVRVFAGQKGATEEMEKVLEDGLRRFADLAEAKTCKSFRDEPGSGSAGGLGFALMACLGAVRMPGIQTILSLIHAEDFFKGADLVITGEGRMDGQSIRGKAPLGVASLAKAANALCFAVVGGTSEDVSPVYETGKIDFIYSLPYRPMSLEECMKNASALMERAGKEIARLVRIFR